MNETIILALKLHIKNKVEMSVKNQKTILKYINKQNKEIKRLSKEVDMWNKKYNEQFDIINELEKHLEKEISRGRSEDNVWLMGCYDEDREILDKLQELKGDSSNE